MTWQYTIEWHDTSTGSNTVQQAGINSNSKSIVMVSSKPRSQSEKQLISVKAWTTEINSDNQGNLLFLAISGMFLMLLFLKNPKIFNIILWVNRVIDQASDGPSIILID